VEQRDDLESNAMNLRTNDKGFRIELTYGEARYLRDELGDLPLKRETMRKLIQLYRQLDAHGFAEDEEEKEPRAPRSKTPSKQRQQKSDHPTPDCGG
jgi:3-hydroxyisobutyrate dehydrogenase-like beta-hydroxyacid dehydrogenase